MGCWLLMLQAWVGKFFNKAVRRYQQAVAVLHTPTYSVIPGSLSSMHVIFTYSDTLSLETEESQRAEAAKLAGR